MLKSTGYGHQAFPLTRHDLHLEDDCAPTGRTESKGGAVLPLPPRLVSSQPEHPEFARSLPETPEAAKLGRGVHTEPHGTVSPAAGPRSTPQTAVTGTRHHRGCPVCLGPTQVITSEPHTVPSCTASWDKSHWSMSLGHYPGVARSRVTATMTPDGRPVDGENFRQKLRQLVSR